MGTPVNPNDPAPRCPACFGTGKPFGSVVTPRVIQVRLTRLLPGEFYTTDKEQVLMWTHHLEQTIDPCQYHINFAGFTWSLAWFVPVTILTVIEIATARPVFDQSFGPLCSLDLQNSLQHALGTVMYAGFANITWDLEGL